MPSSADESTNGRVTMAVLSTKLDTVIEYQASLSKKFDEHLTQSHVRDNRITVLEGCASTLTKQVDGVSKKCDELDEKVDDVRVKSNWWDGINSTLTMFVGGILLWLKGQQ